MHFKNAWKILQEDPKFQEWKKSHSDAIFSYAFITIDKQLSNDWQFGFYYKKDDRMVTFALVNEKAGEPRVDEVFKEPGAKMHEIDMAKVKLSIAEVLELAEAFVKVSYPKEFISRKILILQFLPDFGLVWNITMMSLTYNSINLKITADTGDIKFNKLISLQDYLNKPKNYI